MKEPNEVIKFKSRSDIRKWAEEQPRDILIVFAARAALRATPYFASLIDKKPSYKKTSPTIILPSLWATNSALFAGTWPDRAEHIITTAAADAAFSAAADAAYATADVAYESDNVFIADAAANAAAYAADAAANDDTYAVTDAVYAAANTAAANTAAYSNDANAIANGLDAKRLAFTPLWPDGKTPRHIHEHWENLKTFLLGLNEDWDVWTDWYESILRGGPRNPDLEIAHINFPHEDYTNAKVLNPKIKALIRTHTLFTEGEGNLKYGVSYSIVGTRFAITAEGNESDILALNIPSVKGLYDTICRKADELLEECQGIGEKHNWGKLEAAIERFHETINGGLSCVPDNILLLFDQTLELAGFLEQDKQVRKMVEGNRVPLPSETHRGLQNLINSLAPWVRDFPSARAQDEKLGETLARPELFEPSKILFEQAGRYQLLANDDRDLLLNLIEALNRSGGLAQKTGVLGQGSAYNLIIKTMKVSLAFYMGATASAFAEESIIVQKAKNVLLASEAQILEIMADAPSDIKMAIEGMLKKLKELPDNQPSPKKPTLLGHENKEKK